MKSKLMFFVHHFIRPIWALYLLKFIFFIIYCYKYITDDKIREKYKKNKKEFLEIKDLSYLIAFYRNNYIYKWDSLNGVLDHDNSKLEFFCEFGDCNDMGSYSSLILKKLNFNAKRIGILGDKGITSWHYDCLIKENDKKYVLFNYGDIIISNSIENVIKELNKEWDNYWKNIKYWKCYKWLEYIGGLIIPFIVIFFIIVLLKII